MFCFLGGFIVFIKFRLFFFGFRIFLRVIRIENKNDDKLFEFFNSNVFIFKERKFIKLKLVIEILFDEVVKVNDILLLV